MDAAQVQPSLLARARAAFDSLCAAQLPAEQWLAVHVRQGDRKQTAVHGDSWKFATRTLTAQVLERAVIEHNMLATSKLYNNISFEQLGALLGIDAATAERIVSKMLVEERLKGSIDQVESLIAFDRDTGADPLSLFDGQIEHVCRTVETVANGVSLKHPQFAIA